MVPWCYFKLRLFYQNEVEDLFIFFTWSFISFFRNYLFMLFDYFLLGLFTFTSFTILLLNHFLEPFMYQGSQPDAAT